MSEWWQSISTLEQIFWFFAVPFSIVFIIQLIMAVIGFSSEQELMDEYDADGESPDPGLRIFSIRNIIIFFTIFGWTGIAAIRSGLNEASSVFMAFGAGFLMMYVYAKLFQYVIKLTESGTMDINNAKGQTGTVYLKIPGNRTGIGKVSVDIQGAMREIDAVTDDEELHTGDYILVLDILQNNILLVQKYIKE